MITNGYVTLSEYKAYNVSRGQSASADSADDTVIEALIEATSRYIDEQTRKTFYKDTVATVRYFTACDHEYIDVDPFVSISELKTDYGARDYSTTWASTDYDLYPDNAALENKPYTRIYRAPLSAYEFPLGVRRGAKVTAVWGYPTVPKDIWEACQMIAQGVYMLRSGQASTGKVTITAAGMVIRPEEVPPTAQKIIESYRPKR